MLAAVCCVLCCVVVVSMPVWVSVSCSWLFVCFVVWFVLCWFGFCTCAVLLGCWCCLISMCGWFVFGCMHVLFVLFGCCTCVVFALCLCLCWCGLVVFLFLVALNVWLLLCVLCLVLRLCSRCLMLFCCLGFCVAFSFYCCL